MSQELNLKNSSSTFVDWEKKDFLECKIYVPEEALNLIDDNSDNLCSNIPNSIVIFDDEIKSDFEFKISNERKKNLLSDVKKFLKYLKYLAYEFIEENSLASFKKICEFLLKCLYHMGDIVENMMGVRIYDNIHENVKFHLYIIFYSSIIEIFSFPTEETLDKIYLEDGLILLPKLLNVVIEGYLIGLAWFTDKLIVTPLCTCFHNSIYQISKKNFKEFWKHVDRTIQIVSQCQITKIKESDIYEEFVISLYNSNKKLTPACFFILLEVLHNFYKSLCLFVNINSQLCFPLRMITKNVFPSLVQTRKENLSVYLFTIYEMLLNKPVKEYEYCDTLITYSIHALIPTFNESSIDNILENIFDSEDIYTLHCNLKNFYSEDKYIYGKNQHSWCVFVKLILLISKNTNVWTKNESKIFHLLNIRRLKQVTNETLKKLVLLYFGIHFLQRGDHFKNISQLLYYDVDKCDIENRILRLRLYAILVVEKELNNVKKNTEYIESFKKFAISIVNCISMLPECIKIDKFLYEMCNVKSCLETTLTSLTEIYRGNINAFLDIFNTNESLILWHSCWKSLIEYWSNPRKYFLDKIDLTLYNVISSQLKFVSQEIPADLSKYFEVILLKCNDKFTFKRIPKDDLIKLIELYLKLVNDLKIFSRHSNFISVWFCILLTYNETPKIKKDKIYSISAQLCNFVGDEFTTADEFLENPSIENLNEGNKYLINYVFSGIKSISDVNNVLAKQLISHILSNDFCEIIKESFKNDNYEKTDLFIYFTVELFSNLTQLLTSMQQNVLLVKSLLIKCSQTFLETTIEILKNKKVYESKILIDNIIIPLLFSFFKLNLKDMDYLKKLTIKIIHLGIKDEYFINYKFKELFSTFPCASSLILDAKALNY
ncbi:Hypothetical protein SRAE_2000333800 [Strongyloides ratti]|uniref:Methyl methanesulfonate-sensitivity protein 22-like n=1 Tax=Strongyloides ratti TaxID=34506 RepID=A0A090LKM6_STRRB|nr:Hypothetical protein SRAE_2000333800 [Strongyloides ratti]CEF68683.1 Hypothetical protein SRAE_2000333800 [Strongyloides ratti]